MVKAPQIYCTPECRVKSNQPAQNVIIREWHKKNPTGNILKTLRHRAKKKGLEFNLTKEDIVIPEFCPVFGFKLEHNFGSHGGQYNSPSVDRVDNSKGYIKGNIQIISRLANAMKSDATNEQLVQFARWIIETHEGGSNG